MRVLVTGGCGFIGSHVVDCLLSEGHRVTAVDDFSFGLNHWLQAEQRPEIRQADITQRNSLAAVFQEARPQVVFHLAAHADTSFCEKDPVAAHDVNVFGTHNILAASWNSSVERFFFASTAEVYAPASRAQREDDATAPSTVHSHTKLLGESLCRGALNWGWNTNMVVGRLFSAVGKRDNAANLVPATIRRARAGLVLHGVDGALSVRDFVDVRALAQAMVDVTLAVTGFEVVNLGSGVAFSVQQMLEAIPQADQEKPQVSGDDARRQSMQRPALCANVSRLRRLIGRVPKAADAFTLREMLDEHVPGPLNGQPVEPIAIESSHRG